jgi:hypothetical protein
MSCLHGSSCSNAIRTCFPVWLGYCFVGTCSAMVTNDSLTGWQKHYMKSKQQSTGPAPALTWSNCFQYHKAMHPGYCLAGTVPVHVLGKFHNRIRHRKWNWEWDGSGIVTHQFTVNTSTIIQRFQATNGRSVSIKKAQAITQSTRTDDKQSLPLKMSHQTATDIFFRKERVALTETHPNHNHETLDGWERILLRYQTKIGTRDEATLWSSGSEFCIGVSAKTTGEQTAFSWAITARIENEGRTTRVGCGNVPKTNQHDTPCTGELLAIHASLFLLQSLVGIQWKTNPTTVTVCSANSQTGLILSHLWKVTRHNPQWRLNRNWEILSSIQRDIETNQLDIVEPDNDELGKYAHRTAERTLLEYSLSQEFKQRPLLQPVNQTGRAYLRHGLVIINDKYDEHIHESHNAPMYKKYLCEKKKWSSQVFQSIEWNAFGHEAKKLNVNERTQLLKFVYGWLPIGDRRRTIDQKASIACPSCGAEEETHDHLLQCEAPKRKVIFESFIESMREMCDKQKVKVHVTNTILAHIRAWGENSNRPALPTNNTPLRRALIEQNEIGWDNCMRGWISSKFQSIVNQDKANPLSRYELMKWTTQVVKLTWQHELSQWKARNEAVHGETKEEQYQKVRERLLDDAADLYAKKWEIHEPDRTRIFHQYFKIIKKKNRPIKAWLQLTQRTVHFLLDSSKQPDDDPNNNATEEVPPTAPT